MIKSTFGQGARQRALVRPARGKRALWQGTWMWGCQVCMPRVARLLPLLLSAEFSHRILSSSLENAALKIILGKYGSLFTHFGGREIEHFFIFFKSISSLPHLFLGLPAPLSRVEKGSGFLHSPEALARPLWSSVHIGHFGDTYCPSQFKVCCLLSGPSWSD